MIEKQIKNCYYCSSSSSSSSSGSGKKVGTVTDGGMHSNQINSTDGDYNTTEGETTVLMTTVTEMDIEVADDSSHIGNGLDCTISTCDNDINIITTI